MKWKLEPLDFIRVLVAVGALGFLHEARADLSRLAGTLALIWRHGLGRTSH